MDEGYAFLIKIYCNYDLSEMINIVNKHLNTRFENRAGKIRSEKYAGFYLSLEPYDFFDAAQQVDFYDNYTFEMFVSFISDTEPDDLAYLKIAKFAKTLINMLHTANCLTEIIFTFALPDGRIPLELLNG